jgi:hypothetical protein
LVDEVLYKWFSLAPLLNYLSHREKTDVLKKSIGGVYGLHTSFRALATQVTNAWYYWPTILSNPVNLVKKCDQCQKFASVSKQPFT